MNYQTFRTVRDRLLAASSPLRLDCMNPAKALAHLVPTATGTATTGDALRTWRDLFAPDVPTDCLRAGTGIRGLLPQVFATCRKLWLPGDVYPEYHVLADRAGLDCHDLVTVPTLDLAPLVDAGPDAALLLPQPLAPLGRYLSADEVTAIRQWLAASPRRRLLLDTVYHFANRLDPVARALWDGGQTYLLHSLAKGWLLPDTLGVLVTPDVTLPRDEISPEAAGRAVAALRAHPDHPADVEATFRRQWAALADRLRAVLPQWQPPVTGYFSVVALGFDELLRHDLLAVPATVFGSHREDLSIVSCLYYRPGTLTSS